MPALTGAGCLERLRAMDFRISSNMVPGASWMSSEEAKKQLREIADLLETLALGEKVIVERVK